MHSRSFKQALRATVRASIVASAFAAASHADWKSPTYPLAITCLVHDSGAEFLPPSLWDLEPDATNREGEATSAPTETNLVVPFDPVEDCAKLAIRFDNQQLVQHAANRAESTARSYWNATCANADSIYRHLLSNWIAGTTAMGNVFAAWANNPVAIPLHPANDALAMDSAFVTDSLGLATEFRGCSISAMEQKSEAGLDCPWDRLPSGNNPNVFVFTLDSMGPHPSSNSETEDATHLQAAMEPDSEKPVQRQLSDQFFARDYCVFAPKSEFESAIEDAPLELEPIASSEVVRPSHRGLIQLQRNGSRQLARGMQWLGTAMLRWSSQLESNIRIAEAGDGPSFDDRK